MSAGSVKKFSLSERKTATSLFSDKCNEKGPFVFQLLQIKYNLKTAESKVKISIGKTLCKTVVKHS